MLSFRLTQCVVMHGQTRRHGTSHAVWRCGVVWCARAAVQPCLLSSFHVSSSSPCAVQCGAVWCLIIVSWVWSSAVCWLALSDVHSGSMRRDETPHWHRTTRQHIPYDTTRYYTNQIIMPLHIVSHYTTYHIAPWRGMRQHNITPHRIMSSCLISCCSAVSCPHKHINSVQPSLSPSPSRPTLLCRADVWCGLITRR